MWYHVAFATVCIDEASHTVGHLIYVQMPSSILEKLAQGDLASLHMQRAARLKQHPGGGGGHDPAETPTHTAARLPQVSPWDPQKPFPQMQGNGLHAPGLFYFEVS